MAAPAKKQKKVVNQQELRRLMREKQRAAMGSKRIESPLAKDDELVVKEVMFKMVNGLYQVDSFVLEELSFLSTIEAVLIQANGEYSITRLACAQEMIYRKVQYNSLGHLSCVLCSTPIKNELLWQTHILGKQHKENLEKQKATKQTTGPSFVHTSTVPVGKRKVIDAESQATKKAKVFCESRTHTDSRLPADFIDPENDVSQQPISAQCSGLSLVVGDYEDDVIEQEDKKSAVADSPVAVAPLQKNAALPAPVQAEAGHSLPADFFDSTLASSTPSHSGSIQKPEQSSTTVERKENTAETLPEGFFDDPVKDAKVRNVDPPKDQMDKEWEEFQKEIRQVNTVSEAIVAEDDEEVRLDRQIEEIDEQIMCYRRVEHLRDRQETVKLLMTALKGKQSHSDDDVGTDEEEEFQEFLSGDWRAKGALL